MISVPDAAQQAVAALCSRNPGWTFGCSEVHPGLDMYELGGLSITVSDAHRNQVCAFTQYQNSAYLTVVVIQKDCYDKIVECAKKVAEVMGNSALDIQPIY